MPRTTRQSVAWMMVLSATVACTGCTNGGGPFLGIFAVPIPVSPYFQDAKEDQFTTHERYARVPIHLTHRATMKSSGHLKKAIRSKGASHCCTKSNATISKSARS